MASERVLFARIGWMHFYKGIMPGDERPVGGGKWNEEHVGGEVFNFRDVDGWLYGYVEPMGSITTGRIAPELASRESAPGTLVIFVARHPTGGQRIVGWYNKALVLSEPVKRPRPTERRRAAGSRGPGVSYNLKASAKRCVLLPIHKRTYDGIPAGAGGMGESNLCYALASDGRPKRGRWIRQAVRYVRHYKGPNLLFEPLADAEQKVAADAGDIQAAAHGQGFAQNPEERRAVERLAMLRAMAYFRKRFESVKDVSRTESYDIRCSRGRAEVLVEVKGTTSAGGTIFLTRREVELARKRRCALFVLHSIQISNGTPRGGTAKVYMPWRPSVDSLSPLAYSYKLS